MYAASEDFHKAVANGNKQMALLIFSDAVFTGEDIDADAGIEFDDNFNMETDLAIGQMTSNEIRFTLFNDNRYLNGYKFGEFTATIGVYLRSKTYTQKGSVMVMTNNASYAVATTPPYLRRNDVPLATQPSFAVKSLLGYDDKLWAFSSDGKFAVYNDKTGENITSQHKLNTFMRHKVRNWAGKGIFYNKNTRMLMIYEAGTRDQYEFVPLGVFMAERPKSPDQISISMTCYDQMQKFEIDMPTTSELGISYPITIGNLYKALCNKIGVKYETNVFINSDATIEEEPDDFSSVTARSVLGWIAEAAASNARFNRDGVLTLKWIEETNQSFDESGYTECAPYWYETKKIDKLYSRKTSDGTDTTVGTGSNAYLIQDNPLLP